MVDELIPAIDEANAGLAPLPFGKMEIVIQGAPASVQSTKVVKEAYLTNVKNELARFSFTLTVQLILEIV